MEWISVKDRLPETSGEILLFTVVCSVYIGHYKISRNLFTVYGIGKEELTDVEITHWMPLPEPPTETIRSIK